MADFPLSEVTFLRLLSGNFTIVSRKITILSGKSWQISKWAIMGPSWAIYTTSLCKKWLFRVTARAGRRHLHSTTMALGLWRHAPRHWQKAVQLLQRCRDSRVALEPCLGFMDVKKHPQNMVLEWFDYVWLIPWWIHGAGIYANMTQHDWGFCWWDPWSTIYSSTVRIRHGHIHGDMNVTLPELILNSSISEHVQRV